MTTPFTRTLRRSAGALLAAALAIGPAVAKAWSLDFELVNRTNQPIVQMWAVPTGSSSWGVPFRNTFVSEGGGRQSVSFNRSAHSADSCIYSVLVRFSEGAERYWTGLNLCNVRGLQVYVTNGEVKAATW